MTTAAPELARRARELRRLTVADPVRHLPEVRDLLAAARQAGDTEAEVLALHTIGSALLTTLDAAAAKTTLDRAVRVARRSSRVDDLGAALVSRAGAQMALGRSTAAFRDLAEAAALPVPASGPTGTADPGDPEDPPVARLAAFQHGVLAQNLGRLSEAAGHYRTVLAAPDIGSVLTAKAGNNLGLIEIQLGRPAAAFGALELARRAAEGSPVLAANVASSRAWVSLHAGRILDGLEQFEQAEELFAVAGSSSAEHAIEYADALLDLRLVSEAAEVAERVTAEFQQRGAGLMAAEGILRLATARLLQDRAAEARRWAHQAHQMFREQRRPLWAARATVLQAEASLGPVGTEAPARTDEPPAPHTRAAPRPDLAAAAGSPLHPEAPEPPPMPDPVTPAQVSRAAATVDQLGPVAAAVHAHLVAGRTALAAGSPAPAVTHLTRAVRLAEGGPVLLRLHGALAGALAARTRGDRDEVLRHCRAGLSDLARHRDAFGSLEMRVRAGDHGGDLGRLGLEELLRGGTAAQVFAWTERTRAASLTAVAPVPDGGLGDELAELRAVGAELERGDGDPVDLLARQAALERRIGRITRRRAGSGPADEAADGQVAGSADSSAFAGVSPTRLRRLLAGRALVSYAALADRLVAVTVGPRGVAVVDLGQPAPVLEAVERLMFAVRRLSRPGPVGAARRAARAAAGRAVADLAARLIDPLALDPVTELVVVPSAILHRVPWSALRSGPVAVAPSAAVWATGIAERSDGHGNGRAATALVAGPGLQGARTEVLALQRVYPNADALLPPDSTVAATQQLLGQVELAHLACHSRLRADNPMFSSLQLTDGALTLHELDLAAAAPRRMVLAACNSAAGIGFGADDVLGFVSALLARGTRGVLASVVAVPDAASALIMPVLHAALADGGTMASALATARSVLDPDDPAHFVTWCAFNAYGAA
ncbi:CHAT domain-containing protein [Nakamurella leprariae]|uniref:CHAT domain-containing protein n=1 Tax=Nakamurella leprariae TaxID=2803911 RepID=A0A938YED1_9ACTN|nr:CHAT domain-containing protein [Nakamurella leprariae]MBM9468028.1 CHAT domain-containing protein [Nakamurella leprariae]